VTSGIIGVTSGWNFRADLARRREPAQSRSLAPQGPRALFSVFLAERGARLSERNSERQPDYRNLDLRLSKAFDVGPVELELIGEVFNALNEEIEFVTATNQVRFTGSLTNSVWSFRENPDFCETNSFNNLSVQRQYRLAARIRYEVALSHGPFPGPRERGRRSPRAIQQLS
jgi:hypothetical protein